MTNIKAKKAFTIRSNAGALLSVACGQVVAFDDTLAARLITDGLAEEYRYVIPTGEIEITANGTVDVTEKASVVVNVGTVTVTYDANGGTGSVAPATAIAGNSVVLSDGTGLTAPEGKAFAGWATESTATEADVESPLTVTEDVTLYAVWGDA